MGLELKTFSAGSPAQLKADLDIWLDTIPNNHLSLIKTDSLNLLFDGSNYYAIILYQDAPPPPPPP